MNEVSIFASKCELPGTSAITPETIYLIVSDPILNVLSIGFSSPNIFLAVDSDRLLYGSIKKILDPPSNTGIEKKLKKDESASTR